MNIAGISYQYFKGLFPKSIHRSVNSLKSATDPQRIIPKLQLNSIISLPAYRFTNEVNYESQSVSQENLRTL